MRIDPAHVRRERENTTPTEIGFAFHLSYFPHYDEHHATTTRTTSKEQQTKEATVATQEG